MVSLFEQKTYFEEKFEQGIRLFILEAYNALRESWIDK
jgi:hypothetical protein